MRHVNGAVGRSLGSDFFCPSQRADACFRTTVPFCMSFTLGVALISALGMWTDNASFPDDVFKMVAHLRPLATRAKPGKQLNKL
jgi:hypothetical protein